MEDGKNVVLHVQSDMVSSVVRRCPERWSSRLNAGCAERQPLTWLKKADPPSESRRIIGIVMDKFTTDEAPTSAGRQHWCLWSVDWSKIAPQLHSTKQSVSTFATSSCSSAATIDEAVCTRYRPRTAVEGTTTERDHRHCRSRKKNAPRGWSLCNCRCCIERDAQAACLAVASQLTQRIPRTRRGRGCGRGI